MFTSKFLTLRWLTWTCLRVRLWRSATCIIFALLAVPGLDVIWPSLTNPSIASRCSLLNFIFWIFYLTRVLDLKLKCFRNSNPHWLMWIGSRSQANIIGLNAVLPWSHPDTNVSEINACQWVGMNWLLCDINVFVPPKPMIHRLWFHEIVWIGYYAT